MRSDVEVRKQSNKKVMMNKVCFFGFFFGFFFVVFFCLFTNCTMQFQADAENERERLGRTGSS